MTDEPDYSFGSVSNAEARFRRDLIVVLRKIAKSLEFLSDQARIKNDRDGRMQDF